MNQRDITYAKWSGLVAAVFLIAGAVLEDRPASNAVQWLSFEDAKGVAASQNKPIFVDVYADWCEPCKMMDKVVFPDDSVKGLLTTCYVLAKINGDDPVLGDSLKRQLGIRAYPTYIVLGPMGREKTPRRICGESPLGKMAHGLRRCTNPAMARSGQSAWSCQVLASTCDGAYPAIGGGYRSGGQDG